MVELKAKEKEVLTFWKQQDIFEKLRKKNKGKKQWSFIDGPITANNPMGVHHAWGRTYKDVFQRFKAMQGFDQRYQNGFDCQGLWVEREEEKELGLKNKQDIERLGILNFVNACKKRVEKFSKIQQEQSIRLGQWMDWDNNYSTMSDVNNLHNWHLLKTYFKKGMLYQGKDSVPWCWRCGTASSKHDIVTEGYKEVTHTALFMRFPLKDRPDEYFLIFTTTPWTVPVNVALAVNPNIEYVKVEQEGKKYWLAASRLHELEGEYKIVEKRKGKALEGTAYGMPYAHLAVHHKTPHHVVLWDLASEEEGTGIVHIAPGCGAEDFDLGKKEKLPAISPLDESGRYEEGYGELSFKSYAEVNKQVLRELEQKGYIYKKKSYHHRYPHCWRCGEELVFRVVDEWYIRCTPEMRAALIKANKNVRWFPEYGKKRQEEWFKNMGDWLISRKRYWGLPLPVWKCECGHIEVIGSLQELREKAADKKKVDALPELHRPWIDDVLLSCPSCKKAVKRVQDVGDAWLDAGIVPFSTLRYLEDVKYWKIWFPADFICENMPGQYRGWFNALFWASVALTGKAPTKSILGYETLKDEKGEEMHKSKGNAIWFDEAVEKVGADPLRLLYCLQDPAQELRFGFTVLKEPTHALLILYNIGKLLSNAKGKVNERVEDCWIVSRCNSLITTVTQKLEEVHPHTAVRALQEFWLNDLSRGYIQCVRERLAENDAGVQATLRDIYTTLLKLLAPIIPLTTELIWQELRAKNLVKEESVHLADWPKADTKKVDEELENEFAIALKVIESGMAQRDAAKIGLRWPLQSATFTLKDPLNKDMEEIIARQLNVKHIMLKKGSVLNVALDTALTPELEAEGFAREVARNIQSERKRRGLEKKDTIALTLFCDAALKAMLEQHTVFLQQRTNAKTLTFSTLPDGNIPISVSVFTVRERKIGIKIS